MAKGRDNRNREEKKKKKPKKDKDLADAVPPPVAFRQHTVVKPTGSPE